MNESEMLYKALNFIVELEEDNDRICEALLNFPSEMKYCEENCHKLNCNCVRRYLRHYKVKKNSDK
jgi:hypothetical protein